MTFTAANWNTPQTVTITPNNDTVVEGPHTCSPATITATNGGYTGVTATPPTINITDNDVGTITVAVTDAAATEAGNTGAFTVRLGFQPSANVTVSIGTSAQCNFSAASLTFTTANWNTAQTVTVTPINDVIVEGAHTCSPASITAANGNYDGVTATPPTINITDNDVGTITLVTTDSNASEAGNTGAFTVRLGLQPSASVTVSIGTSPQCNFSAASLTFTTANWNTVQTVTVTPIDDAVAEGAHTCSPSAISAANGSYDGVTATPPTINIADNDSAGITVSGGPLTVTEAGSSATFAIVLTSQPTGDVTVPLAASNPAEASVSPASLTFSATTWNVAQTVTVTGVDDAVDDGDVVSSVTIGATTSSDANYSGLSPTAVGVTITDDDSAGITVSGGPLTVTEAGSSATFTIVLTSQPTGDVTVPLAASNPAEASISPASLTFTATTWNVAQTVTVTGVDDAIDDGDVVSSVSLGPTTSGDANYSGLSPAAVGVTTADNDAMINAAVREAFKQQTHDFMARRQGLLLSHEPSFHRLVNRGFAGWSRGENSLNLNGYEGDLRGSFSLNARSAAEVFSDPGNIGSEQPYDPSRALNAWAEGQFGLYADDEGESESSGDFFFGYAGIDWRINERLMIGVMGELDWLHETSTTSHGDVEGTGWMVGPYISYAISEKLFWDLRAMWGRSENRTAQEVLGSLYRGDFDTERWLVDTRLAGLHRSGSFTIRPELGLTYMSEDQLDYAVAGNDRNLSIDGQFVGTGMISAGGEISQTMPFGDILLEPFLRGRVLWSFDDPMRGNGTDISIANELGGQVGVGLAISDARTSFSTELTYGAIGLDNLNVFGAKLSFQHAF